VDNGGFGMSLNISKGNMYDFVTHTWNTIKGKCFHDCSYCYMKRFPQKDIRFDSKELKTDLGAGNFIFVGSSNDMFAENVPLSWITKTTENCWKYNNKYLFQTKNPERIFRIDRYLPLGTVICTTIETNRYYPDIMRQSPSPQHRADFMSLLSYKKYVTIEPIMDFDIKEMVKLIKWCEPEQVNIGADSGGNGLPEPEPEKIIELISELKKFTVIHKKRNLKRFGVL
jgi:DNA repair photolyase